jgi:hypothetical protein
MENPFPPPKETKPCPECGGVRILSKVNDDNPYIPHLIALNSKSLLWGYKTTPISTALVCIECGNVSFFVEDPSIFKPPQ